VGFDFRLGLCVEIGVAMCQLTSTIPQEYGEIQSRGGREFVETLWRLT